MEIQFNYPARLSKILFAEQKTFSFADICDNPNASIFVDSGLGKLWMQKLIVMGFSKEKIFSLAQGEQAKEWSEVGKAVSFLTEKAHERTSPVIVIGGGAACDAGALVASIYKRGVPLILIPTSLLAMIDASIGGKTAIDLVEANKNYKNVAGTFYPADKIYFWREWLSSLPQQQRYSGLGELLKMLWLEGVKVDDHSINAWLEDATISPTFWDHIQIAIEAKTKIVQADPLDTNGRRAALNYGHTLGHAFESLSQGQLSHGEAIAWGMWAESSLHSDNLEFTNSLRASLDSYGFKKPLFLKDVNHGQLAPFLLMDKKMHAGKINMHVLTSYGCVQNFSVNPMDLAENCVLHFNKL